MTTPARAPTRSSAASLVAVVVAALLVAGCAHGGPSDDELAARERASAPTQDSGIPGLADRTTTSTTSTVPSTDRPLPDTRGVEIEPVGGAARTDWEPVEIEGGTSTLIGSLGYAGGPVAGATVRLERWVGGNADFIELETGEGGGWMAEDIHGGRYVVRAWKGSSLVLADAGSVFVPEGGEAQLHLAMISVAPPPSSDDEDDEKADDDEADDDDKVDDDEGDGDEAADDDGDTTTGTDGNGGDTPATTAAPGGGAD